MAEIPQPAPSPADAAEVEQLVRRAASHALGRSFLLEGSLDAVAATFGVHAFVVDAARDTIQAAEQPTVETPPGGEPRTGRPRAAEPTLIPDATGPPDSDPRG